MRSFEIDHNKLLPGIYYHSRSGMIVTWDIRMKTPNGEDYLSPEVIHTIEHTLAKFMRDRFGNYRIVGIFPMGCQTGFYIVTRFIDRHTIYQAFIDYAMSAQRLISIPGATPRECGQAKLQDLLGAKKELLNFYDKTLRYADKAINYNKN